MFAAQKKLEAKIEELRTQLEWCKRQIFGQKSERQIDPDSDHPLLPWGEELPNGDEEPDTTSIPPHKRRKKTPDKGSCTIEFPDDMPEEVIIVDPPADELVDPITGKEFVVIGEEEVVKLAYRQQYIKKIFKYRKYGLPKRPDLGVMQAPAPPCVVKGSKFDVSFMGYLAHAKYALHLPLNRIQEDLRNFGIKVTRQTLSSLLVNLGIVVLPLWDRMIEELLRQGVLYTDDTPVNMLNPGAGKTHQGQVWTYIGGGPNAPPYHVYEYTMNRSHKHPFRFLRDYVGFFHGDAFPAHVTLDNATT